MDNIELVTLMQQLHDALHPLSWNFVDITLFGGKQKTLVEVWRNLNDGQIEQLHVQYCKNPYIFFQVTIKLDPINREWNINATGDDTGLCENFESNLNDLFNEWWP